MKLRLSLPLALSSLLVASAALAEDAAGSVAVGGALPSSGSPSTSSGFGSPGKMVVGFERLFQFSLNKRHIETEYTDPSGTKRSYTGDDSNVRFNLPGGGEDPYSTPSLSFHYFVAPSISVGGGITYYSASGSEKTTVAQGGTSTTKESDKPTTTNFAITPRVGYNIPIGASTHFWLRGGITYWSQKTESVDTSTPNVKNTDTTSVSGLSVSLDPMLLLAPVDGVAFMIGPVIDFPLTGSGSHTQKSEAGSNTTEQKTDITAAKFTQIGAAAGFAFYF